MTLAVLQTRREKNQQSSILVNTAAIGKLDSLSTCLSIWKRASHDLRSCLEENHERPRRAYPAMLNPNPLSVLYAMSSVDLRNLWKSQVQVWVACGAAEVNTINHDVDERAREREREREIYIIYIFQSSTATAFFMRSRAADLDWVPPPPASQRQQPPILAFRHSTCRNQKILPPPQRKLARHPFPIKGGWEGSSNGYKRKWIETTVIPTRHIVTDLVHSIQHSKAHGIFHAQPCC